MPTKAELELADDIKGFYADPLSFVKYVFPWGKPGLLEHHSGPDQWQEDFLKRLAIEVQKRNFDGMSPVAPIRMLVSSGHGIGKSVLAAWLTLWIMATRPRCRGVVSASTWQQLSTRTWSSIQQWSKLGLCSSWFTVTADRMWFRNQKEAWFTTPQSCKEQNSEAFAGQHAADSSSFYIFDEASAIPDKIWEVAEGGLTDGEPMIFAFGNPTRNQGKFFRAAFGEERERWHRFSVDSRNSRFTNKQQIAEWVNDYGEDSDFVRVRVRGEAPRSGSCQLISSEAVARCRKATAVGYGALPKILSCDVARFGDDRTVIGLRQGRLFRLLLKLRGLNTVQVSEQVIECMCKERPDMTIIDGDGLGAGVVDQVKVRKGSMQVHEFHGGATPRDPDKYFNKRAEIWGLMADWLSVGGAQIPDDPEMEIDLTGPEYGYSSKGQIQLERKEDMKARGLASPDLGDCLAMTFAVNVQPTIRQEPRIHVPHGAGIWY